MSHRNARLTPTGRRIIIEPVLSCPVLSLPVLSGRPVAHVPRKWASPVPPPTAG